jgi:predicted O-linked N-acetylglucosamine transferase (SPINDLY family)
VSAALLAEARAAFAGGDDVRALDLAQRLAGADPRNAAALSVLANAAMRLQRLDTADASLAALLALRPGDAALARSRSRVLNRIGHGLHGDGDLAGAARCWRDALALWPDNPDAAFNLVAHAGMLLADEELPPLLRVLESQAAGDAGATLLLAEIERDRGDRDAAALRLAALDDATLRDATARALTLTLGDAALVERALPASVPLSVEVDAAHAASATLATLGEPAALATLHAALRQRHAVGATSPTLRLALAEALSLPSVHVDGAGIGESRARFADGLSRIEEEFTPARLRRCASSLAQLNWSNFMLAYQCEDDRALQSRYGDWLAMAAATLRPELAEPAAQRRPGPPRIGLLSGHWNDTTAGSYFASWIDALDIGAWDTRIYALGPRFDAFTDELAAGRRAFLRLDGDIDAAADAIRAADLDLLIYPELGMDTRLLPLAALPLARRQWAGWGHPVTTGLPTIDAYLSCADMEPAAAADHYRERLLLLPDLGTRYRLPPVPIRHHRAALALPEGPLVVVPQSLFKIHPDNDAVIDDLLARVPAARVLLFAGQSRLEAGRLRARLARRLGTERLARLHWHPLVGRARFLEILAVADLMLDTLHWSGGNTSLDALRAGLPIATTRSRFMRGRQSAAMLTALGMPSAIAPDASALAALAASMLRDRPPAAEASRLQSYVLGARAPMALRALASEAVGGVV